MNSSSLTTYGHKKWTESYILAWHESSLEPEGKRALKTEMRLVRDLLTLMCSNSLSVSTLTDWLMILSREELALCADSSLPCGSHCLQRSTKDLQDTQEIWRWTFRKWQQSFQKTFLNENVELNNESLVYLRGGQQLTRAMVLETYPSPLSPNSAWVSWNISAFLWKLDTEVLWEPPEC